jgi:hypothetical protein
MFQRNILLPSQKTVIFRVTAKRGTNTAWVWLPDQLWGPSSLLSRGYQKDDTVISSYSHVRLQNIYYIKQDNGHTCAICMLSRALHYIPHDIPGCIWVAEMTPSVSRFFNKWNNKTVWKYFISSLSSNPGASKLTDILIGCHTEGNFTCYEFLFHVPGKPFTSQQSCSLFQTMFHFLNLLVF